MNCHARSRRPSSSCSTASTGRLRINISGQHFDVMSSILDKHPDTLLGNRSARSKYYDPQRKEFFFDRHRPSFEVIFSYYLHGKKLKRPNLIPEDVFIDELEFFQIERHVINEYKKQEGYSDSEDDVTTYRNKWQKFFWELFERPKSSNLAFVVALMSVTMIVIAIVILCLETLPRFATPPCQTTVSGAPFFIVESICNAWFTLEFLIRLFSCPSLLHFIKDFRNMIDFVSIIPYFVTLATLVVTKDCLLNSNSSDALAFLRVIRLVRIFKLTKHSLGLQVLVMTFKASIEGLGMFFATLIVCMLLYSSALYYAEANLPHTQINSIPDAFWWAIITMTTVGYGDIVPIGPMGKLIGAACAISGILTLAIPVPIIAGHFNKFYTHKTGRARFHRDQ